MSSGARVRPRWLALLCALSAAGALWCGNVGSAAADDYNARIVPLGTFVRAANGWGRTDTTSPSFLIEASGGILKCATDDSATQSCGPAPATCAAAVCALYSPGPLGNGDHTVYAEADQSDDETEGGAEYDFDVDLTPPELLTDGLVPQAEVDQPRPLHPTFHFSTYDDDENAVDTTQCSVVTAGAAPKWGTCTSSSTLTLALPRRQVNYTIGIRALDDLDRPSKVLMLSYDPLPCTVGAAAPASSLSLELHGLNLRTSCRAVPRIKLVLYLVRLDHLNTGPPEPIGQRTITSTGKLERVHLNLDIYPGTDNLLKSYRTVRLRLTATAVGGPFRTTADSLGQPAAQTLTIHNHLAREALR